MRREKSCGAVVFKKDGDEMLVLVLKHRAGHWDFPKGHMEAGESEQQTALREVQEESGILAQISPEGFRRQICYSPARGTLKDVVYFIGHYVAGELKAQPSEISQAAFMSPREARLQLTYRSSRLILSDALEYLKGMETTGVLP